MGVRTEVTLQPSTSGDGLRLPPRLELFSFFHATTTGANDSTVASFLRNGIAKTKSDGHGQGTGFYVFTSLSSAISHAMTIQNPTEHNFVKAGNVAGSPMIVSGQAILDLEKWDLDHEIHRGLIGEFLHCIAGATDDRRLNLQGDNHSFEVHAHGHPPGYCAVIVFEIDKTGTRTRHPACAVGSECSDTSDGILYGRVTEAVRANPALKERYFDFVTEKMSKPPRGGLALKYFGTEQLPIRALTVLRDGVWTALSRDAQGVE